ncbi:MAG: DUF4115 domain-containing protein [Gloeomargarita sp. SKYBB_i_bin120]|nr:DUF4115 domain-containing protein [Gloeomargarita sp. SKYG98]MCS7291702.1 DUF4115 domain-containing protein [Gloeomargarita sp. SKYB120]MDW8177261.1 DUF4115 domain-containing protein [Gloeomargarita sp. SKYBB_i_bin120]
MKVSLYTPAQAARLREIGQYLRQVREDKHLSLADVSAHTHIQTRMLRALEEGDVQELPEPVYVRGFLRQYARLLQVEDLDLSILDTGMPVTPLPASSSPSGPSLRPWHLYLTYFALILGAIGLLSYLLRPTPKPQASLSPAPETPARPKPSPQMPVSPSPVAVTPSPAPASAIQVQVEMTGQSWLQVVADGQVVFEGILSAGATQRWTARETLVLAAGNAGEVQVRINDGPPQPLGEKGEVKEVKLTAQNPRLSPQPLQ